MGIGVVVVGGYMTWDPHRHSQGRDVGWAEAVGFELLARTRTLVTLYGPNKHFECHGDNRDGGRTVEGIQQEYPNQQSSEFRRLHDVVETTGAYFHTTLRPQRTQPGRGATERHPRTSKPHPSPYPPP
jgi:hypothetical protein